MAKIPPEHRVAAGVLFSQKKKTIPLRGIAFITF
jgi:hypothetical protein